MLDDAAIQEAKELNDLRARVHLLQQQLKEARALVEKLWAENLALKRKLRAG